jgi:branched-subunit amino acid ABC-type transport system permease component
MDIFLQQLINGLVLGSVYALVALGYTMVYGILELINFAHGEITMMGAMVSLAVIVHWHWPHRACRAASSCWRGWPSPFRSAWRWAC